MSEFQKIWEDQAAFNLMLRQPPRSHEEMVRQARDYVLYTESELHELLRLFKWKEHRRHGPVDNPQHRQEEIADVFKCVISLAQICGMSMSDLFDAYWRKTLVVRQRYDEEWVKAVSDQPIAVIDIDNVLCDYPTGMADWLADRRYGNIERLREVRVNRLYVNHESIGVPLEDWQAWKHEFRVTGAKRQLPAFPDALTFLIELQKHGMQIVLLTSRPIDKYPNIYTDTLLWLKYHQLPFDFIWWANDKAELAVERQLQGRLRFVVDDEPRFIRQFERIGCRCFWMDRNRRWDTYPDCKSERVSNLMQVLEAAPWDTKTPNIDHTPSGQEKIPLRLSLEGQSPSE
jgi:NTP pyrophosphatase (non-canonical NTP hydrolase)